MMHSDRVLRGALVAILAACLASLAVLAVRRPASSTSPPAGGEGAISPGLQESRVERSSGSPESSAVAKRSVGTRDVLPTPPIPGSLVAVFDRSRPLTDRMKALDGLRDRPTVEETAAIRLLLRRSDEDEALRNSAARKLLECGEENLASDLTEMLWDEKETPKWRNYCVQFLKDCYDRDGSAAVLTTIFEAAEVDEEQVRSCGIWALARIATPRDRTKAPDGETLGRIRSTALDALQRKDAHFLVRLAGVQSCARLGLKGALPEIREIAENDNAKPTHLRVVAVAALGDLGDETDVPLLDRLASSAKGQVKSAAAHAFKKVRARSSAPAEPHL